MLKSRLSKHEEEEHMYMSKSFGSVVEAFKTSLQKIESDPHFSTSADEIFKMITEHLNIQHDKKEVPFSDYSEFPNPPELCSPMYLPLHAPPESLDLSYLISLCFMACKGACDDIKFRKDSVL